MTVCGDCSFVFNADFDPELLSYGQHYDNSQNFSPAFESHVNSLVARLVDERVVRSCSVVEVGCGKGEFLRKLAGPKITEIRATDLIRRVWVPTMASMAESGSIGSSLRRSALRSVPTS